MDKTNLNIAITAISIVIATNITPTLGGYRQQLRCGRRICYSATSESRYHYFAHIPLQSEASHHFHQPSLTSSPDAAMRSQPVSPLASGVTISDGYGRL
ncbi:hypothetical protein Nepgr_010231 [Nepenthes gracilis]|uniref:Uncharacterized protein n=1 Tax=Nepenthes gracilis TaxID=150966 RepID=A0AAD3SCS6_NEPGR|nr:hypothetical protein Nepgr_010231 [Nepenthes gracilis]